MILPVIVSLNSIGKGYEAETTLPKPLIWWLGLQASHRRQYHLNL